MRNELPHPTIKHVVVLMLEGRAFDHLMGWLYAPDEQPQIVTRLGDRRPFLGLSTLSDAELEKLANTMPDGSGTVRPARGARSPCTPTAPPANGFVNTMRQMWGVTGSEGDWKCRDKRAALLEDLAAAGDTVPRMTGYVLDYALATASTFKNDSSVDLAEILDTYLPEQLPVLSGFARHYAVSDEWYASVPGSSNANRAFALAGTSRGMVDDGFYAALVQTRSAGRPATSQSGAGRRGPDSLPSSTRSVFEVLHQAGINWKVYWQAPRPIAGLSGATPYVRTLLPLFREPSFDPHFVHFDAGDPGNQFFEDARGGRLPAVSWVEPRWSSVECGRRHPTTAGNDMRSGTDVTTAEEFLAGVYHALAASPAWPNTLLVICFASGGGTYDHLPPPAATPSANDRVPLPTGPAEDIGMDPETRTQHGFSFTQYGARVPALLVSPRVQPGTVFRSTTNTPFDHTSLPATILSLAGVKKRYWQLGRRVAKAPTFEALLTSDKRPSGIGHPGDVLNAPSPRTGTSVLQYNVEYLLSCVGSPHYADEAGSRQPLYLGPAAQCNNGQALYFHPTLTRVRDRAVRVRLIPGMGSDVVGPALNMAMVRIAVAEPLVPGFDLLCAGPEAPCVYFSRSAAEGTGWQLRMPSSRDSRQVIPEGVPVYFVIRWRSPEQTCFHRLAPHPHDSRLLGLTAHQWGLWQLNAATDSIST